MKLAQISLRTDEQCLADGSRQPYGHEVLRRIEIIFAGFIDNAYVPVVRGGSVREKSGRPFAPPDRPIRCCGYTIRTSIAVARVSYR
jgi:hypothetical protein